MEPQECPKDGHSSLPDASTVSPREGRGPLAGSGLGLPEEDPPSAHLPQVSHNHGSSPKPAARQNTLCFLALQKKHASMTWRPHYVIRTQNGPRKNGSVRGQHRSQGESDVAMIVSQISQVHRKEDTEVSFQDTVWCSLPPPTTSP